MGHHQIPRLDGDQAERCEGLELEQKSILQNALLTLFHFRESD